MNQIFSIIIIIFSFFSSVSASDFKSFEIVNNLNSNNDVFETILHEYANQYQRLGEFEAKRILDQNSYSLVGGLNSIGLSVHKPFANFNLILNRNLAPDLFDSARWIVTDSFSVEVDATKLLTKLKNDKIINISEKNLLAYAGVIFKRDYTWIHYSDTYESGLTTHFEKLFFPFTKLNKNQITALENNEIIFREDKLSFSAAALASVPLYHGVSAVAGSYLKYQLLSKLEVINYESNSESDHIHISQEKSQNISLGLSAEIQLDLLKILRLTLFKMESSFDKTETLKIYLNIPLNELREMPSISSTSTELEKVLNNRQADILKLSKFIISEEVRTLIQSQHKYNFLIFGGKKEAQTEQVDILMNGKVKKFFKHNFEKIKFQEDVISKIFASIIYALTQTEANAEKLISESKKVTVEYESEFNLIDSKGDLFIDGDNTRLSLSFLNNFSSKKIKTGESKITSKLMYFLEHMTMIDPEVRRKVISSGVVTPFEYQTRFLVNTDGIRYFNSLSVGTVLDNFTALCGEYPKNKFFNFRNLFDHCRVTISNDYMEYLKDLSHNKISIKSIDYCESRSVKYIFSPGKRRAYIKQCLMEVNLKEPNEYKTIPMWSLKKVVTLLSNNIEDKVYFYNLFGVQNVFNTGFLSSNLDNGDQFITNFHGGNFKGYGVIENYKQESIYRLPAAVEFN